MVYLLALGCALLYGASDFAGGLATRRASAVAVTFLAQAGGLVLLGAVVALYHASPPSAADVAWGAGAGAAVGVGVFLLYHALAIGTMAVVAPTTAVCAVAIPVVIAVALGERPAPATFAGIGLAVAAIVLVSRQRSAPGATRARGIGTALASGVAIGLFFFALSRTRAEAGLFPLLVARAVSTVSFGVAVLARRQSLRMPPPTAWLVAGCGVLDVSANVLYLLATRQGQLSVVVTLSSLYPASTVLLARVILGERMNRWQIAGVASALAAIWLIVGG